MAHKQVEYVPSKTLPAKTRFTVMLSLSELAEIVCNHYNIPFDERVMAKYSVSTDTFTFVQEEVEI